MSDFASARPKDFGVPGYVPPTHFVFKCPRCHSLDGYIAKRLLAPCEEYREMRRCRSGCPDFEGVVVAPGSICPHCWESFVRRPGSGRPRTWCYGCLPASSDVSPDFYAKQGMALMRFKRTGKHSAGCCVTSRATCAAVFAAAREERELAEFYEREGALLKAANDRANGRSVEVLE